MKKYQNFYLKIFLFLVVKFSIHLNRRVFIMYGMYTLSVHTALSKLVLLHFCKLMAKNLLPKGIFFPFRTDFFGRQQ